MQQEKPKKTTGTEQSVKPKKWYKNAFIKRIGVLGFLFFLIKGLLWLAFFFGFFKWLGN